MRLVLFDGDCVLCCGSAARLLRADRHGRFRLATMQGETGQAVLRELGLPAGSWDSFIFLDRGTPVFKSDAVARLAGGLPPPWSWIRVIRWLPRRIRDGVYDAVASRRYRLFGRRDRCFVPTPDQRARILP